MLVSSQQRQVTPRRKYSRGESSSESTSASLTMFTRAQASAVTTPASAKSSVSTTHVSSQPVTTIATSASGTAITSGATEVIPNVSLTITAVAATSVHDGIPIITTSSVPALDTPTITNYVLNSLEGVHSGVPTRTTPTLTPTTLRNIEQTFLELSTLSQPESHTNQAGFVPPLVQPNGGSTYVSVDSKCWGGGTLTQIPHTSSTTSSSSSGVLHVRPPAIHTSSTISALGMPSQIQHPPRRMGGRRPMKEEKLRPNEGIGFTCVSPSLQGSLSPPHWFLDSDNCDLSVEEEEKRSMRRERNKLAAARCRKRRLDQTNLLQDETDDLEDKKSGLQQEIQLLQQQRDELEFLLATHKAVCRRRFQNSTSSSTITSAGAPIMTTAAPTSTVTSNSVTTLHHHHPPPAKKAMSLNHSDIFVKEEPSDDDMDDVSDDEDMVVVAKPPPEIVSRPRIRPTSLAVSSFRTSSVADLGVPIETPSAGLRGLNFESMMEGGTGLTPVTSGASGLTPLHTGLTPLTTPICSVPTSSGNCGSQQRSSSSDLSSPDSVPPKLVSL